MWVWQWGAPPSKGRATSLLPSATSSSFSSLLFFSSSLFLFCFFLFSALCCFLYHHTSSFLSPFSNPLLFLWLERWTTKSGERRRRRGGGKTSPPSCVPPKRREEPFQTRPHAHGPWPTPNSSSLPCPRPLCFSTQTMDKVNESPGKERAGSMKGMEVEGAGF